MNTCRRHHHPWTTREIARLRAEYPVSTRQQLAVSFARHTPASIYSTAQKLGLHKNAGVNKSGPQGGSRKWKKIADAHNYQTKYFKNTDQTRQVQTQPQFNCDATV